LSGDCGKRWGEQRTRTHYCIFVRGNGPCACLANQRPFSSVDCNVKATEENGEPPPPIALLLATHVQELAIPHEMELGLRTQLQLVQAGLRVAFAKPTIATTVGQAVELLVISRGLLRLFIIAQHMLRRSSRVVPLSPSIDVHSSEQLEQQLSCLSQALSLMLNVNADDHAARPMSLPPTQSQAGDGGAAAMAKLSGVSEPEALILLKHAQLLLRHHATLLTLVQASILAVRELEQRLELLVSPLRSAAAHEPEQNSTAVSNAFMGLSSVLVGWMRGNDASTAYAACTPR